MENFKILEERENPLFARREIKFNVEAEVTPSHVEVEKLISEKFSASSETMKIRGIHGRFGSRIFTISVNIYNSREDRDKTEPKSKKEEKEAEEQPATGQPVIEEPKQEEKSEEKIEEQSVEEKPASIEEVSEQPTPEEPEETKSEEKIEEPSEKKEEDSSN